ncbi:MAG: SurA N-terminal domain-containing protein [Candidatus Nomurabacteria bacterium]|jgi:hypothetical protein|nr:SurA N-terminal domain-containing protein [Candidatus Nomurabacteria bacterium]
MKKKLFFRKKHDEKMARQPITNDTIEEHRSEVLAKGLRFRYPLQYEKHKIVINATVISVLLAVALLVLAYVGLYKMSNYSDASYGIVKVFPLPVAEVDGEKVLYSDYLMQLRSSIRIVERQEGAASLEDKSKIEYYKRQSLDNAIVNAYAMKLAKELDIKISREQIDEAFKERRKVGNVEISEKKFLTDIVEGDYGLTKSEYERMVIEIPLIRQEVLVRIDEAATELKDGLDARLLKDGSNFDEVVEQFGEEVVVESSGGMVDVMNLDGGRAIKAHGLEVGQVSAPFLSNSGDCYYFVRLSEKDDTKVSYVSVKIPLMELQRRIETFRVEGKIKEYIKIDFGSQT